MRALRWRSRSNLCRRSGKTRLWIVSGCVLIGLILIVISGRKNVNARLNVPLLFDDFAFTMLDVTKTTPETRLGPSPKSGMVDLIVTLRIHNRARRVDFQFDDAGPLLFDSSGHEYTISKETTAALETKRGTGTPTAKPLPAGASVTKTLVFEVPPDLKAPRLKILGGGRIGEVLEFVFFGKKQFILP